MARIIRKLSASAAAFCRDTSGVILPYVTMMITAIMAMSVLAIDGSRYMSLQSQLQNGADALALAGAAELDQKSDSITRANNAILNHPMFTNPTLYGTVSAGNANVQLDSDGSGIRFLSSLPTNDTDTITSAYVTTDPLVAKFVEVTVKPVTLTMVLPRTFVGAASSSITSGAVAVAGFPNTVVCNFPPLFVCNPYETTGMTDDAATAAFRTAMGDDATKRKQLRLDSSKTGPGQFGYLIPPDSCNGASCLTEWIAKTSPKACYSKAGVDLNTGQKSSVNAAFNVRFDIPTGSLAPDANHAPAVNVRKGYVWPKSGQKDWCHANLWSSSQAEPQCLPSNTALQSTMALPNDTFSGTNIQGNGIWDCASYWTTNHTGAAPTGCSATPTMSRYQMYRYEIDHSLVGDPTQNVSNPTGCQVAHRETGNPLCAGTSTAVATPDRRNIVVAVVNCLAHSAQMTGGSTANNIPVSAFAKYFVTRPVGDDGTNNVYGEFTGFATRADGVVILDQVQLYR